MANRIVALEHSVPEQPPLTGLRAQFAHPRGVWGSVVGHIMALTNAQANQWLLQQLEVRPTDRVLDVGSGPGVGVKLATRLAYDGVAIGIDPSETMLKQSIRRNASLLSDGKAELHLAPASSIPFHDAFVDRIMSFNTVQFLDDLEGDLAEMNRVLRPSGKIALGLHPRATNLSPRAAHAWGDRLKVAMRSAGFVDLTKSFTGTDECPMVAVIGRKPVALAPISSST